MRLGIMAAGGGGQGRIVGLVRAAVGRGHEVVIFATGGGTRLLADAAFTGLSRLPGVSMAYCDHSARLEGVATAGLPAAIRRGSQLDNAVMAAEADKLVVL